MDTDINSIIKGASIIEILERAKQTIKEDLQFYEKHKHQVRVGRIVSGDHPSFPGFKPIVCLTKSSAYGDLGPYVLADEKGRLMENLWQFAKVYKVVPPSKQTFSQYDKTVVWDHPAETHVDDKGCLTLAYWKWRAKGMANATPVRYPVGRNYAKNCLYSFIGPAQQNNNNATAEKERDTNILQYQITPSEKLSYVEGRKRIYAAIFMHLLISQPRFTMLKELLVKGENLLIIEVDGPHDESLSYYTQKYSISDPAKFIQKSTILATTQNLGIMLHDEKHAFGHGYCFAMALLGLTVDSLAPPTEIQ